MNNIETVGGWFGRIWDHPHYGPALRHAIRSATALFVRHVQGHVKRGTRRTRQVS